MERREEFAFLTDRQSLTVVVARFGVLTGGDGGSGVRRSWGYGLRGERLARSPRGRLTDGGSFFKHPTWGLCHLITQLSTHNMYFFWNLEDGKR